jgi:hypothetical protein
MAKYPVPYWLMFSIKLIKLVELITQLKLLNVNTDNVFIWLIVFYWPILKST